MVLRHGGIRTGIRRVARVVRDNGGVTALEYGLLTGLIALAIAAAVTLFGSNASVLFTTISNTI